MSKSFDKKVDKFIETLSKTPSGKTSFNPYEEGMEGSEVRRNNLKIYFNEVKERNPERLLIGESAGYFSAGLTGIPFTSEGIMLRGVEGLDIFGEGKGYETTGKFEEIQEDETADIMWDVMNELDFLPLLWNVFPFHPHRIDDEESNRRPLNSEIELGQGIFEKLVEVFDIDEIIAVGNIAHKSLRDLGLEADKIRHPAHGGRNLFTVGMKDLVK